MKKLIMLMVSLLLVVPTAFAADFSPTVMKITAPPAIHYDFDGSVLEIPVSVKGTPANMVFTVYTKDQAASIPTVRNGYLGWHMVNKIDTCMYWEAVGQYDIGSVDIMWDGNDQDGNAVPAGDYTYYLFGYDSVSLKTLAAPQLKWAPITIVDHDPLTGAPLDNPWMDGDYADGTTETTKGRSKWTVGNDPSDLSLLETTIYGPPYGESKAPAWSPYVEGNFYTLGNNAESTANFVRQFNWVPNGESTQITDWGDGGLFTYSTDVGSFMTFDYVGGDILACCDAAWYSADPYTPEMVLVSASDGEELTRLDLSEWWVDLDDEAAGGQASARMMSHDTQDGYLIMGSYNNCLHHVINPSAGFEPEEYNVWINDNGDYIGDHNFEEGAEMPWVCFDYNVAPWMYSICFDSNMFSVFPCYDLGAVSFGLMGPDGTGIEHFAYAGETAGAKYCTEMVNYGSAYDGMYSDNTSAAAGEDAENVYYVGYDSIKGVITSAVVVEEVPAGFSVAQNSPNPFNPTTTINFTIAEAGNVTIDVFNVAGQKVDTVANEFISSGNHSVVWDASGFSAGVYFYTVKSGDFTKTMKMTLLK